MAIGDGACPATDTHHYQLGAGVSVTAGAFTVVVDLAALGERAASLGVSVRR